MGELVNLRDRTPLILFEDKIIDWIKLENDPAIILPFALTNMVMEKAE